jgi:hypothetical protein
MYRIDLYIFTNFSFPYRIYHSKIPINNITIQNIAHKYFFTYEVDKIVNKNIIALNATTNDSKFLFGINFKEVFLGGRNPPIARRQKIKIGA